MLPEESHALLSASESGETSNDEKPENTARTMRRTSILRKFLYCSLCICLGFIGGLYIGERLSPYTRHSLESPLPTCNSPSTRLEWRSLHDTEKHDYIQAVQCLRSIPSILSLPQSLYDDFPYVHMHVGNITHDTAGFLPWHRYFVHIYETALRNRCNYTGAMVYWDWTQDWANFRESPVWDSETGFGGDGGVDAPRSVGEGRCVTDGPFAGLNALYSNLRYRPHCFSRGFPSERELARWTQAFRPEAVKQVMAIQEYESFYLQLENGPHLAIPYSIRGDFYRFTAPYGKTSR